ncbi:MAG: exodeoxyribonuclease VII small subunit, partial [Candidatus Sulfotelmatobacter sp.]
MPKFEECLQRLEKIVQELEKGDVPLETSLTLFEEGMH